MIWFVFLLCIYFCSSDDGPFFETHYHKRSINVAVPFATTTEPASIPRKNQMLLIVGGVHSSFDGRFGYTNQCFGFINGHTWVPKSPLPYEAQWPTLSRGPDGKVIASGGQLVSKRNTNETYLYDVAEDRWETGPTMNSQRVGHYSVSLGSKVYAIGGAYAEKVRRNRKELNSVEEWDWGKGNTSKWEYISPMKTARYGPSATIFKGDLYVVGGWGLKSAERYVFQLKNWEDIPDMIHGRWYSNLVTLNDKIYAVGGYDSTNFDVLKSVESFDGRKWVEEAPLNTERQGAAAGVMNGKIYVVGGVATKAVFNIEVYDPSTSTWSLVNFTGPSPLPIFQNGAVVVDLP